MKLHCLGTTGFHPSPRRHTACYYLPEQNLVLDAGTGIFRLVPLLLQEPKKSLDLFLSHAHLDHIVGLTFLVDTFAVTELEHVRVFAEKEKIDAIRQHLYNELLFPVAPQMEFIALESNSGHLDSSEFLGDMSVNWFPLEHPGGTIGMCFANSHKKFAYVTDTVARPDAEYVSQLVDCDLLLHECYFQNAQRELAIKTGHSWLSAVEEIVRKVTPKKTLLIHINPLAEILNSELRIDPAFQQQFDFYTAEDEMCVDF
ncbi:MAG: MBL fold metallo-hydrolase [Planctomycetota bacterium]